MPGARQGAPGAHGAGPGHWAPSRSSRSWRRARGASKVYAVEGNPEAAERAREAVLEAEDVPENVIEAAMKWLKDSP